MIKLSYIHATLYCLSLLNLCSIHASHQENSVQLQTLFDRAIDHQKFGYIRKAGDLFFEAGTQGHQESVEALTSMAKSVIDKDKALAREIFKKTVLLGSLSAEIDLGDLHMKEGNHEDGIAIFKKIAEQYPTDVQMQSNLALTYETAGRLDLAE